MTEAKNGLSALLAEVKAGETVVIVDRGIPVARLEGVAALRDDADGRVARLERAGVLRVGRCDRSLAILAQEPPRPANGASAVAALLEERSGTR